MITGNLGGIGIMTQANASQSTRRVEDWKSRLIDLSRRNNLLYFHKTKRGNLPVSSPDAETIFNALVVKKRRLEFWLPPEETQTAKTKVEVKNDNAAPDESKQPKQNQLVSENFKRWELEKILKNLQNRSLLDYRERGVRILYAAFGKLTWVDKETKEQVVSPLVLVPIELIKESFRQPFTIEVPPVEEEAVLNPALQVKLKTDFKIDLPVLPEDWENQMLTGYLDSVSQAVTELGWKVEVSVDLGLFSFYKLVIYKDLEANSELVTNHPIIRAIVGTKDQSLVLDKLPQEKDVDKIELPEKTYQVLDADSSQRVSIDYALRGQSFVMKGPPGTGKSQTIANIIAESIANGKSVLFVSDKMAALEVVYKRLSEVGLANFCLELHSSKANKQQVVAELKRSLEEHLVPRKLPSNQEFQTITQYREALNGYVNALHEKRPYLEKSAYDVLSLISSLERVPYVQVGLASVGGLTYQKMRELEEMVSQLSKVWRIVEEEDFPWIGYRANTYNLDVRSELLTGLEGIISAISQLRSESEKYSSQLGLSGPALLENVNWLISLGQFLLESPMPEADWLTKDPDKLAEEAKNLQLSYEWIKDTQARLLKTYNPTLFSLSLNQSKELQQAFSTLNKSLPIEGLEESDLLVKREKLLAHLKSTQVFLRKCSETSQTLLQIFGLTLENLTIEKAKQLSKIAALCFNEDKPELQWFDQSFFLQVQELVPKAQQQYLEHNLLRAKLEKIYTNGLYDLDLDELVRRFSGPYTSFSKLFSSKYREDKNQIARVSLDGKVPKTVLNDLIDARRQKILRSEIQVSDEALRNVLGHFYRGYKTDFERVDKAVNLMAEIQKLSLIQPIPESLLKLLTSSSQPSPMIKHLGTELSGLIDGWQQNSKELQGLIPQIMPNSTLSIDQTSLSQVEDWAKETENQLANLLSLIKDTLVVCKEAEPATYKQFITDLQDAEETRKKQTALEAQKAIMQTKFGSRYKESETNWTELISVLEWTAKVKASFGQVAVPETYATLASKGPTLAPSIAPLSQQYQAVLKCISGLEARFETELKYKNQKLANLPIQELSQRIETFRSRVDELQVWVDFKNLKNRFANQGLEPFFNRLVEQRIPAAKLIDVFRRGTYQEWINNLYNQDSHLGSFRRENHEQLIADFKALDRELIYLTSSRVIEAANQRKPQDILIQADDSEAAILMKEAAKKRRLMPIRTLMQKIPNLLVKLKPCLLMSPISVSQFLTPELSRFDLVLFDEASQIVPEDAIGSIYRGKTLVVAGDNKQLPPTSFFQKSLIDDVDWDEVSDQDVEVFDSILDECLGIGLPVKTLRWHYRSKHESLIAFSNSLFYDDNLITFPAMQANTAALGVKLIHIPDGVYDRGGKRDNPKEAEAIATMVFDHFTNYPKKTLGVVTFSIAQMEAVQEAIDRRLKEKPEFEQFFKEDRLEGFFVKNLENVQGDERDVIFFSVGYGRDLQGQMAMNFGPLNKPGGERRLNVAVTRAREKVALVTSIKASDINPDIKALGVQTLRSYLIYAQKEPEPSTSIKPKTSEFETALDEDVASEIQKMGYKVIPQVGCSGFRIGIGVVDPANTGCYLLGIEFDGVAYKSSNSARDRDRLREQVLKNLGWRIHRIWAPTWVSRRDSEVKRLKDALEQAQKIQLEKEPEKPLEPTESLQSEVQKVQFAGIEKIGVPYMIHPLKATFEPYIKTYSKSTHALKQVKNEFYYPDNRHYQTMLLLELVEKEGPIHFDYAVQRLVLAWGVKRVTPKITQAVREALSNLIRDQKVVFKGQFLWPPKLQSVPIRVPVRGAPKSKRKPEHIPPEEVESAMIMIAKYALSISNNSLIAETAKIFGINHSGEQAKTAFNEILARLVRERKLVCIDDVVTAA